ncbi:MAG: hypothetical protein IJG85_05020 [Eubacteriaceae bacterium]|nr:hypothetical protein [Eubacteriaceae bacterium]
MKLMLKIPDATLNRYIGAERKNKFYGATLKKRETDSAAEQIKIAMLAGTRFTWPARLKFIWHLKNSRTDPDNIAFTKKFILDGMQDCGFLENDNVKNITGFTDDFIVDGKNIVEIQEIH